MEDPCCSMKPGHLVLGRAVLARCWEHPASSADFRLASSADFRLPLDTGSSRRCSYLGFQVTGTRSLENNPEESSPVSVTLQGRSECSCCLDIQTGFRRANVSSGEMESRGSRCFLLQEGGARMWLKPSLSPSVLEVQSELHKQLQERMREKEEGWRGSGRRERETERHRDPLPESSC